MRAFAIVALVLAASMPQPASSAQITRAIDGKHSTATFDVKHLYVADVSGSVPIVSGTVAFAEGQNVPSAVDATLDARRIATDDADRDDDLQGPDWFDTKQFPSWTFSARTFAATRAGFRMDGTLTVHGHARAISLTVVRVGERYRAVGTVDRRGFGMRTTPMDALIGGDVSLVLDIELAAR